MIQESINVTRTLDLSPNVRLHDIEAISRNVRKGFYLNDSGASFKLVSSLFVKRERPELEN